MTGRSTFVVTVIMIVNFTEARISARGIEKVMPESTRSVPSSVKTKERRKSGHSKARVERTFEDVDEDDVSSYNPGDDESHFPGTIRTGYQDSQSRKEALAREHRRIYEEARLAAIEERKSRLRCCIAIGVSVIVLLVIGIVFLIVVTLTDNGSPFGTEADQPTFTTQINTLAPVPDPSDAVTLAPTIFRTTSRIDTIRERGFMICGISQVPVFAAVDPATGKYVGIDVDLCRAVAAGIFGDDFENGLKFVEIGGYERFSKLDEDKIDLLAWATTWTMQRDISEASTGSSFQFSTPYLYSGIRLGGIQPYLSCVENSDNTGICADAVTCAQDGTTIIDVLLQHHPDGKIKSVLSDHDSYAAFVDGDCNVLASDQFSIVESVVKSVGMYQGDDYETSSDLLSSEPYCLVTRTDDPFWSDYVNWIVQGLLSAESNGITQQTASFMPQTDLFGTAQQNMSRNSVRAVGNFAEIYERNLQQVLPRASRDRINDGSGKSGVFYSPPLGDVGADGPGPTSGGTLETILARGRLLCGVAASRHFAVYNETADEWSGFDVDCCKMIASAIFGSKSDSFSIVKMDYDRITQKLSGGHVDLSFSTHTFQKDVWDSVTSKGSSFSLPNFYDGLSFDGEPIFSKCAEDSDVTSAECRDLKICAMLGIDTKILLQLFSERFLEPISSAHDGNEKFVSGACNVYAGKIGVPDRNELIEMGYEGEFRVGQELFSRDPRAIVMRQDDTQWIRFVNWIVISASYAEENGIDRAGAQSMPIVNLFGSSFANMFRDAIGAVGNVGEIIRRNFDGIRGNQNQLNKNLAGPQHYPLPGIFID